MSTLAMLKYYIPINFICNTNSSINQTVLNIKHLKKTIVINIDLDNF